MSPADPQDHCQGWVSASETKSPAGLCPATDASINVSKGKNNESASPDNVHSIHVQLTWVWCLFAKDWGMPAWLYVAACHEICLIWGFFSLLVSTCDTIVQ